MKLPIPIPGLSRLSLRSSSKGFTLTEIMVAMAVFLLVVTGILTAHLFGLRMFQLNLTKLGTTEWSRNTFGKIADEVRSGNLVQVGNVNTTNSVFTGLLDGEAQQGNGLLIYPTTDTNSYILYFLSTSDQTFRRTTDQAGTAAILANNITNTLVFSAQDFWGNVLSNSASSNGPVVHLMLQIYQPQQFQQSAYQYKLETSMTRRTAQ